MVITESKVLLPGNDIDIGITARKNTNGFVAVDIGMACDPEVFTPEMVALEAAGLGGIKGWRFCKEYFRDWLAQSGQPVFEPPWIERQHARAIDPIYCMDLDSHGRLVSGNAGRVKVFVDPQSQPEHGVPGVERVTRQFGIGMDVGEGVGESDSTIQVMCRDRMEHAAEFASNRIHPAPLGRLAAAVARYFNNALICPVRKMHGITVIRGIKESGYTRIWHSRTATRIVDVRSKDLGWPKGEATSADLFGPWMNAMEKDAVILHGLTTIQQHGQYIYDEFGRITHQALAHLPVEVRQRHGDLVIGIALAYRACLDLPRFTDFVPPKAPVMSFKHRREEFDREKARKEDW